MSEWKDGFRLAMIDAIVSLGSQRIGDSFQAMREEFYGGWQSGATDDTRRYIGRNTIDYGKTTWTDSKWEQFADTFADHNEKHFGLDAIIVLTNGNEFRWRYEGSFSRLVQEVIR